jgi:site-specific DNA recombinase
MRAIIYARYSSANQREASIEDQVRICKERVIAEGWDLVKVLQDRAMSGASSLRPGYQSLLEGARQGKFDVVVAEALDRLSRDQEDVAALYKRMRFAGVKIITLAEGEITELHVGLKGTMNALFLKDLAEKTRRGMRGRVEAGMSGGGNTYGYRVVRRLGTDGLPVTGEREIDSAEAAVVLRVFQAYADGKSPRKIALELNADGITAPRGGAWSASTVNGNRARGTGVINNELYIGRLVWNRLAYVKDPETGRRRSRQRSDNELIVMEVPNLRVVAQDLWDAVRGRQARLEARSTKDSAFASEYPAPGFWTKQRPRYLFSGLMRCGECGGGFSKMSAQHFGCAAARNKGPTACKNLLTIRRDVLENAVLDKLRNSLMDPDLFQAFVAQFVKEWNRLQGEAATSHTAERDELERIRRQIGRFVDAIAEGTSAAMVKERLTDLEARRLHLEAHLAAAQAPAIRLHPNLADVYREKVAGLADALMADDAAEVRERIRGLVEAIILVPDNHQLKIEVRGELAAILSLAGGGGTGNTDHLVQQVKLVAGARSPLYRTTIRLIPRSRETALSRR